MATPANRCTLRAALRMKPMVCLDADRNHGLLMSLHDTTGLLACDFTGYWIGDAALHFFAANGPALVAGRCVDLQLSGLHIVMRGGKPELRARIDTCQLAPPAPSHVKRDSSILNNTHKVEA